MSKQKNFSNELLINLLVLIYFLKDVHGFEIFKLIALNFSCHQSEFNWDSAIFESITD